MIYLSLVQDRNDVADLLNIKLKNLTYILFVKKPDNCYYSFEIPKKTGGTRKINAPCDELKAIQKKLANILWDYQQEIWKKEGIQPNLSHGFIKGKSIFTNAIIHKKKRFVLNLDLSDFFDSFHFGRVCGFFEKNKYFMLPHEAAVTLTQIACYNGRLPQGSPCSPIITNLICQVLDIHLLHLAKEYRLDYTRYADDLTFSTNDRNFLKNYGRFLLSLNTEINRMGFNVNPQKTRLVFNSAKQTVTGLVVNEKINIEREYYRNTRAMANHLYKTGEFRINGAIASINQLDGRFSFIDQIDHFNNMYNGDDHDAYELSGREKEYQAFLFYKYFFANEKPLIITEGKTDVIYLKAALKNLYLDYPNLIVRKENGEFEYKIRFLQRSKRIQYFFKISADGADTFVYLYNCFGGVKNKRSNYCLKFQTLSGNPPKNPVILLFDNEINDGRPLKKMFRSCSISEEKKQELIDNLSCCPLEGTNLYLHTLPLPIDEKECEIEDLFDRDLFSVQIDGRTFERNVSKGDKEHYGKQVFSRYIYSNYKTIDFEGFRPLLDSFTRIILNYNSKM